MIKDDILKDLKSLSCPVRARHCLRFFKTGKGEYGEGDRFIGVSGADVRNLSKKYYKIVNLNVLDFFISNHIHEYRLFALLCLTYIFAKGDLGVRNDIFNYYLKNKEYINNWDLVDVSAGKIVGEYLKGKDRTILYDLINSDSIWDQRIAIVSTSVFIKSGDFNEILDFSKKLISHEHDLIHKALGWMLREVGKVDQDILEEFLIEYKDIMPRTMLRYAIEKFDKDKRMVYLSKS